MFFDEGLSWLLSPLLPFSVDFFWLARKEFLSLFGINGSNVGHCQSSINFESVLLLQKKKEIMQNRKISKILRKTSIVNFFSFVQFFLYKLRSRIRRSNYLQGYFKSIDENDKIAEDKKSYCLIAKTQFNCI